ncbi:C40 family peptidase [Paenibacillus harenae]|uniref:C40 family peptidase n=1 Tax=Paenibacillus harenae TaxID=306543 RepID=UPI0003FF7E10|nr:SH3 domain-containing C40 family peptidase [Paenibacillus harenae]
MCNTVKQRIATATLSAALLFSSISVPAALAAQAAEVQSGVSKPILQNTNAVIKASVSFRKSASTSGTFMRYLKKDEKVLVLSKPNSYWYEVQDGSGVRGYVSSNPKYIAVSGTAADGGSGNTGGSESGGSGSGGNAGDAAEPVQTVEKVIAAGLKYLGTPYEYGSSRSTTTTFDCSDFVRQAFKDGAGLTLPADSRQQGAYVKNKGTVKADWRQLQRGDLIFFMSYKGSKSSSYAGINKVEAMITHDGIYLGGGKVLHTYSKESGGVKISDIEGTHWEFRFLYGGSAL